MVGRVESFLLKRLAEEKGLHFLLLDPHKASNIAATVHAAERCGTAAFLVGGSTAMLTSEYEDVVREIRRGSEVPVIIFPSNLPSITGQADAIFFMSLLNSLNPYFITGAQAMGINVIRKQRLEAIPLAYIVAGTGGAAAFVGQAQCIPLDHPELAAGYAMAAEAFGFRLVYVEAGSGAPHPLSPSFVSTVRKEIRIPLIVGGGIRTGPEAEALVAAGADIIVTGTIVEQTGDHDKVREIVDAIRKGGKKRS